jgi:hypothetical protein
VASAYDRLPLSALRGVSGAGAAFIDDRIRTDHAIGQMLPIDLSVQL